MIKMMMTYVISAALFKPVLYSTTTTAYYRMMRVFDLTVSPPNNCQPRLAPGPCNCRQFACKLPLPPLRSTLYSQL